MKSLEKMLRVATSVFLCLAVACFMVCCDADNPDGRGSNHGHSAGHEDKNLPDVVLNLPCPDCSGDGECHSCSGDGDCDHCHGTGTCGSCHGTKVCSLCHGTGQDDCFYCDGKGYVRCHICYGSGDCSNCNGLGWKRIAGKTQDCPTCHGSGNCTKCHGSGDLKCSICNGKGYDYCVCYTGKCMTCSGKGTCNYCDGSGHCGECEGSNECSHCHGSGISDEGSEILDFLCSDQRKEWYPESDKSNGTVTFTRKGTVYYKDSSESEEIKCRWNPQYDPAKGILISFDDASALGPYADGSYCYTVDDIGADYLLLLSYSGKILYFTTSPDAVIPFPVGPQKCVDLGLSVKWATCNLGASNPEEYGGYYQWAGTQDVTSTDIYLDEYSTPYYSTYYGLTKYNDVDNKTVLDPEDDAAHVMLGDEWRIPTEEEWKELRENCTFIWTTRNGVNGYEVISNKPGYTSRSIFLPAAGHRQNDQLYYPGSEGQYWSSSLFAGFYANGRSFIAPDYRFITLLGFRYEGLSVRPVKE